MSIASQLSILITNKTNIKNAIDSMTGGSVGDNMSDYAEAIQQIVRNKNRRQDP